MFHLFGSKKKNQNLLILVFDTNRVFASQVRDWILEHVPNTEVELAHDIWVVKDRCKDKVYDVILADLDTTDYVKEIQEILYKAAKRVIVWGFYKSTDDATTSTRNEHKFEILPKPTTTELPDILSLVVA